MVAYALDAEYENGVADVIAHIAGDAAKVDLNVRMIRRKSSNQRQIDVRVTGSIFGYGDATMVVDCKRYKSPREDIVGLDRICPLLSRLHAAARRGGLLSGGPPARRCNVSRPGNANRPPLRTADSHLSG